VALRGQRDRDHSRAMHAVDAPTTRERYAERRVEGGPTRRREGYKMSSNAVRAGAGRHRVASLTQSAIGDSAGMGSTTAQMKPRLTSDRDQKAARSARDTIELAAFFESRFGNAGVEPICSPAASERH
jgi:hypothetical protein